MKNLILAGAIALSTSISFANTPAVYEEVVVTYAVEQSFFREFGKIEDVKWSESGNDMFRATFDLYEEQVSAFFARDGKLVATSVQKEMNQLPVRLRANIQKKFPKADITEIIDLTTDTEKCYYFKVTEEGKTKLYKGFSSGGIQQSSIPLS